MNLDWIETYQACRTTGIFFPATPVERLVVTGADRASFLHNLCTNDIIRLGPVENCEAFFTSVKGHVLAHAVVSCQPDAITVDVLGSDAEALRAHLDRYLIREDVTLTIESKAIGLVVGNQIDSLAPILPSLTIPTALVAFDDSVKARMRKESYQSGSDELWNALRIEAGLALAGIDYGEGTLPQELSRDAQAISFTKGCYLGQETVARIDALGHVNKRIVGVKCGGDRVPVIDTPLFADEKQVGQITSATWSPMLDAPLGLAMVRRGSDEPGTELISVTGKAVVTGLPVTD
ncbi:MAG: YgfZ/GcvT domain-containing protein [Aeoliella sp.]